MERTIDEMKELLARWYEAQTTDDEERMLREWFRTARELPAELEGARAMFGGFDALADEHATSRSLHGDAQATRPTDRSLHYGLRRSFVRHTAVWAAAAVVAVGVLLAAGYLSRPYCYINGVAVRDAEVAMQTTVYFEQLGQFDRSMRTFEGMIDTNNQEK